MNKALPDVKENTPSPEKKKRKQFIFTLKEISLSKMVRYL